MEHGIKKSKQSTHATPANKSRHVEPCFQRGDGEGHQEGHQCPGAGRPSQELGRVGGQAIMHAQPDPTGQWKHSRQKQDWLGAIDPVGGSVRGQVHAQEQLGRQ